jgi:hypothetical protein
MYGTHGVTSAQFRAPFQSFQHFTPHQYVVTNDMTGSPFDAHNFTRTITE